MARTLTIRDIAKQAGASATVVSRVINGREGKIPISAAMRTGTACRPWHRWRVGWREKPPPHSGGGTEEEGNCSARVQARMREPVDAYGDAYGLRGRTVLSSTVSVAVSVHRFGSSSYERRAFSNRLG